MGETEWRGASILWAEAAPGVTLTAAELDALGASQVRRFGELTGARATAFLTGRYLVRELARRLLGRDPVLDSRCERCGLDHLAPRTDGIVFSVGHSGGLTVAAASTTTRRLGIDVEADAERHRVDDLGPLFAPEPAPDLAAWTRIEAVLKADGRGVAVPPDAVRMHRIVGTGDEWTATVPGLRDTLRVVTLPGPAGHTLSVAVG